MKKEILRKSIHTILALAFVLGASIFDYKVLITTAIVLFILFVFVRVMRIYARVGTVPRVTFGEFFFAIGLISTIYITLPVNIELFQTSILILAFSDPLAALFGMNFGKHTYRILDEKRTLEGSFVCLFISTVIVLLFGHTLFISLGVAFVLTIIEAFSLRGSDNLFLPTTTAIMLGILV